jgi:hypothetical protein
VNALSFALGIGSVDQGILRRRRIYGLRIFFAD